MPEPVRRRKTKPSIHATAWGAWLRESSYGHMLESLSQTLSVAIWNQGTLNSYLNEYSEWPLALDSQRSINRCFWYTYNRVCPVLTRAGSGTGSQSGCCCFLDRISQRNWDCPQTLDLPSTEYSWHSTGMPGWSHQTQQDGLWSSITAIRSLFLCYSSRA